VAGRAEKSAAHGVIWNRQFRMNEARIGVDRSDSKAPTSPRAPRSAAALLLGGDTQRRLTKRLQRSRVPNEHFAGRCANQLTQV